MQILLVILKDISEFPYKSVYEVWVGSITTPGERMIHNPYH